ncbi:hypothetical protein JNW90_01270 [Micromonospora sp. STR1s_5]|nr:hypothetical protein [Micromonospora sp. STR1s_5]
MAEIVRNLSDHDKPLCPNQLGPGNVAHQIHNRTLDAFYNAAEKHADDEMPEPLDKVYKAASDGELSDRMNLLRHTTQVSLAPEETVTVEAWWFQCPICGFILTAQRSGPQ